MNNDDDNQDDNDLKVFSDMWDVVLLNSFCKGGLEKAVGFRWSQETL